MTFGRRFVGRRALHGVGISPQFGRVEEVRAGLRLVGYFTSEQRGEGPGLAGK